jgi:hypothetical protein
VATSDHLSEAPGGVALLFRSGARPDAPGVRALAEGSDAFSIARGDSDWLELLVNGLAFDLTGLGETPAAFPSARHRFGLGEAELGAVEAIALGAGPHLAEGAAMMPVVRSQFLLTLELAALPGLVAIAWKPAQSWMAVDYCTRIASAWLEGGAFPALGLTVITDALDGGLQSEGLAFFTGQELRIEPELAEDRAQATRLAVRLMNELVVQEAVEARHEFVGPDGAALILEPSSNGRFVRVRTAA